MAGPALLPPNASALALLNQSGAPDIKGYLLGFIGENLPHLNIAVVAQGNDTKTEMQQAMAQALERRPEVRQRLNGDAGLQQAITTYIDGASQAVNATRERSGYSNSDGNNTGPAGTYHFGTNASSALRNAGLDIMVVSLDGHSACRGCKREHQGPVACAEAVSSAEVAEAGVEGIARQSVFAGRMKPVLGSVSTAFHELAHGMDLHGRSMISMNFEAMFGHKQFSSKIESTADAFATLMMIREFGEVGRLHAQNNVDPMDVPQDAGHYTHLAVRDALKWAADNPDALRTMSVQELFEHSRKIGHKAALTQEQAADFDNYIGSIFGTPLKAEFSTDIVEQYRAAQAGGSMLPNATRNAETRIELGRLVESNALSCPAKPEEAAVPGTQVSAADVKTQRRPGAAPGSVS